MKKYGPVSAKNCFILRMNYAEPITKVKVAYFIFSILFETHYS